MKIEARIGIARIYCFAYPRYLNPRLYTAYPRYPDPRLFRTRFGRILDGLSVHCDIGSYCMTKDGRQLCCHQLMQSTANSF